MDRQTGSEMVVSTFGKPIASIRSRATVGGPNGRRRGESANSPLEGGVEMKPLANFVV